MTTEYIDKKGDHFKIESKDKNVHEYRNDVLINWYDLHLREEFFHQQIRGYCEFHNLKLL